MGFKFMASSLVPVEERSHVLKESESQSQLLKAWPKKNTPQIFFGGERLRGEGAEGNESLIPEGA
jgi:hypothetical protein